MTLYIALSDYSDAARSFKAGEDVDDAQVPFAELVRGGLAATPSTPASRQARDRYRIQAALGGGASLVAMMAADGVFTGGGGAGLGEFVFADFGTQDETQGRYTSWADLMAKLATIQVGARPLVRMALTTGPFTVPLAGMPPSGWDFRGGSLTSFYAATGAIVVDAPAGVMFDNLFALGSGADPAAGSVVLKIAPPAGTSFLNFSAVPVGAAFIFAIGGGCAVDHSTDTGALMRSPGGPSGTTMVLACVGANQNVGLVPPLSGPLLELTGDDGAVGVQQMAPNGLPDGWLVGGGASAALIDIHDAFANPNTLNPAIWVPGFTGGAGVITPFPGPRGLLTAYDDLYVSPPLGSSNVQGAIDAIKPLLAGPYSPNSPPDWSGSPTTLAQAVDRLAAAVAGLLGGPIP